MIREGGRGRERFNAKRKGESFAREKKMSCSSLSQTRRTGKRNYERNRDRNTKKIKFRHKFITNRFNSREKAVACAWCASNRNCEKGI
jgi:hypothetical protein